MPETLFQPVTLVLSLQARNIRCLLKNVQGLLINRAVGENMICFVIYGVNIYASKYKFNSFEKMYDILMI